MMVIEFYLQRKDDGSSTGDIDVYFELAFISESGKTLCSWRSKQHTFDKSEYWGCKCFRSQEEVFVTKKSEYLPWNNLTARCKIWRCDGKVAVDKYFLAETRVAIQRRTFIWEIQKFSTIGCFETKHLVIRSITNEVLMKFDLHLTGG
ncbi:speckle-type POZ protein B [Trichonephila clavipes]|nr:speckle-type POZ protein B [Trichonephila clavipes]